jgi:predicted proteasome-type protease
MIYPEGNFIEASFDTPFFQIGETKYGRPILLRGYDKGLDFEQAVKLLMVSFDSTVAANLSVGLPFDLMVIERDTFAPLHQRRIAPTIPISRRFPQVGARRCAMPSTSCPTIRSSEGLSARECYVIVLRIFF